MASLTASSTVQQSHTIPLKYISIQPNSSTSNSDPINSFELNSIAYRNCLLIVRVWLLLLTEKVGGCCLLSKLTTIVRNTPYITNNNYIIVLVYSTYLWYYITVKLDK